ncbi:MAG TPA: SpoIIE family protein phosphatase [Kofleriaceae bacterium]|nr:SpoIIE family protein phosphatase [Kofleriaceae bacterium]
MSQPRPFDLAAAAQADLADRPQPARILVLDDDVAIGSTIRRYLRQYDITVADNVAHARDLVEQHSFDLLLLDRRLPDGLGDTVVEDVRRRGSTIPIIMMSGEIDPSVFGGRAGGTFDELGTFDEFIEKPFMREALVDKIERLLNAHAQSTQAARQRAELMELHERREREIDVARTIFDRIFARGEFDPTLVRHLVLPADRLAGDVVFGARAAGDRYRWMIGDVTGHTLSSALVTMPLAGIFYRTTEQGASLAEVLAQMERELSTMLPANMFCVGAMCELDRKSGTLYVWNGGNPDLLIRHLDGRVTQVPSTGLPLGADRFSTPSHPIVEHQVSAGDRAYAFSDGLIELRDRHGKMVGFGRLLEIARTVAPQSIFGKFLNCIPDYTGAVGYDDDISLIEVIV